MPPFIPKYQGVGSHDEDDCADVCHGKKIKKQQNRIAENIFIMLFFIFFVTGFANSPFSKLIKNNEFIF